MEIIIAVDFDGILVADQFPYIGTPNYRMINFVKSLIEDGHEVVLWTSRVGEPLHAALDWCEKQDIKFCAINDNAPSNKAKYEAQYPQGTRKVSADIYIDDHNPQFMADQITSGIQIATYNIIKRIKEIILWKEEN